jgi:hypothetical protein
MLTYLAGPFLAFLPARWRRALLSKVPVNWGQAVLLSGLVEALAAIAALIARYSVFVTRAGPAIEKHFAWPYSGEIGLLSLSVHPLTWIICYFGLEGAVRMLAGLASDETPATLPLVLFDRIIRRMQSGHWSPNLARDAVTLGQNGQNLRIDCCRPKPHWKYPLTIRYRGQFFQVQGEEHFPRAPERPHTYLLKRLPANEIIRGLEEYDPGNMMHEESTPGFFAALFGELRKKWGSSSANAHSKILDRQ